MFCSQGTGQRYPQFVSYPLYKHLCKGLHVHHLIVGPGTGTARGARAGESTPARASFLDIDIPGSSPVGVIFIPGIRSPGQRPHQGCQIPPRNHPGSSSHPLQPCPGYGQHSLPRRIRRRPRRTQCCRHGLRHRRQRRQHRPSDRRRCQ